MRIQSVISPFCSAIGVMPPPSLFMVKTLGTDEPSGSSPETVAADVPRRAG
jgi:hypothetical protein